MNVRYLHDLGVLSTMWMEFSLFCGAVGRLCYVLFYAVLSLASHGSIHLLWGIFESGCRVVQLLYFLTVSLTSLNAQGLFIATSLFLGTYGFFSSPWCSNALYGSIQGYMRKRLNGNVVFCFVLTSKLTYTGTRLIL